MAKYVGPISVNEDLVNKEYVDGSVNTLIGIIEENEEIMAAAINALDTSISLVGVPSGGTTGQLLTKTSNTDYDTGWSTVTVTDNKVEQVGTNTNSNYPLLFKYTTGINDLDASAVRFGKKANRQLTFNPSTGTLNTYDLKVSDELYVNDIYSYNSDVVCFQESLYVIDDCFARLFLEPVESLYTSAHSESASTVDNIPITPKAMANYVSDYFGNVADAMRYKGTLAPSSNIVTLPADTNVRNGDTYRITGAGTLQVPSGSSATISGTTTVETGDMVVAYKTSSAIVWNTIEVNVNNDVRYTTSAANRLAYFTNTAGTVTALGAGTSGQQLTSNGSSAPSWINPTVTQTQIADSCVYIHQVALAYPGYSTSAPGGSGNSINCVWRSNKLFYKESTGELTATSFNGTASNAAKVSGNLTIKAEDTSVLNAWDGSTSETITLLEGSNITFGINTTNKTITINSTYTDTNTDVSVKQDPITTSGDYNILLKYNTGNTTTTNSVNYGNTNNKRLTFNPNTGLLKGYDASFSNNVIVGNALYIGSMIKHGSQDVLYFDGDFNVQTGVDTYFNSDVYVSDGDLVVDYDNGDRIQGGLHSDWLYESQDVDGNFDTVDNIPITPAAVADYVGEHAGIPIINLL